LTDDPDFIRLRLEQYERLARQTTDERARADLQELVDELKQQLTSQKAARKQMRAPVSSPRAG
jgi:hypothetical protein